MKKKYLVSLITLITPIVLFFSFGASGVVMASSNQASPGMDPVQAGCTADATVVPQPQNVLTIPTLGGDPLKFPTLGGDPIKVPVGSKDSVPLLDANGTMLATVTLFRSQKCGGLYYGEVTAVGNPQVMYAIAQSGNTMKTGATVTDFMAYSPLIAMDQQAKQVCAQGYVGDGKFEYAASACGS